MEITINLEEILSDEYGDAENLAESIKRQIIEKLTTSLAKGIQSKVDIEVAKLIDDQVKKAVECQMPSLFKELIDKEYLVVDRWGEAKGTTTMRKSLLATLTSQMVYKKTQYCSDSNYFTQNVDAVMEQKMDEFKKQFDTQIDDLFTKEALDYAFERMQEKLSINE